MTLKVAQELKQFVDQDPKMRAVMVRNMVMTSGCQGKSEALRLRSPTCEVMFD